MTKKLICFSFLLLAAFQLPAQSKKDSVSFRVGIMAGGNYSWAVTQSFEQKNTSKKLDNLQGGVFANYAIANGFYLHAALEYAGKGGVNTEATVSGDVWISYIELPVDVLYRPKLGDIRPLFIAAGPYFAYGITGQISGDAGYNYVYDVFKNNVMPNTPALFKRFDAGINLEAGGNFAKHWQISINSDIGIANILNYKNSGDYFHNKSIGAMVGYLF